MIQNYVKNLKRQEKMEEGEEKYKLERMKNLMGDAGYDSGARNRKLKEEYDINAIIDIKHIWDKEEKYKQIEKEMIAYNEEREVFYIKDINRYEKMKYLDMIKKIMH